ncbi:MAG: zinc ribbon domain-containing protein [Anaerolineae bacterium]|nr:zinc ribbon domain-containing protein [Anaerolineae bacterium]
MGLVFSRIARLLLRHWTAALVALFSLLALATLYQMWRAGLVGALSLLPQLAICLAVIIVVLVARRAVDQLVRASVVRSAASSAERAKSALAARLAGLGPAGGRLSAAEARVRDYWNDLQAGSRAPRQEPPRCPACSRYVRVGARFCQNCGAAQPFLCPQCGRPLRAQARYCDGCGARVSSRT